MKKIHVLLGQIDDVIAQEKSSGNNEEVEFTPAMLTEMAGELRHALEQVSGPSAKEEKTELKKKRKQLKELEEHRDKLQERGKDRTEKETQTAEGTGRTQGQTAGIRLPSGNAAREEFLFQDGQGRYFYENEGGCHAQRTDEARLQPSNRHRKSVHHRFCTLPESYGYTDPDSFPAIFFKQVWPDGPYGGC